MNELITINYESENPTVSARELHEFLEVKTAYKDWFPRMCEYGFAEGHDFNLLKNEQVQVEGTRTVCRTVVDAALTIPMAKEICMLQRNEKGKIARRYFLELEQAWNTPEEKMAFFHIDEIDLTMLARSAYRAILRSIETTETLPEDSAAEEAAPISAQKE